MSSLRRLLGFSFLTPRSLIRLRNLSQRLSSTVPILRLTPRKQTIRRLNLLRSTSSLSLIYFRTLLLWSLQPLLHRDSAHCLDASRMMLIALYQPSVDSRTVLSIERPENKSSLMRRLQHSLAYSSLGTFLQRVLRWQVA